MNKILLTMIQRFNDDSKGAQNFKQSDCLFLAICCRYLNIFLPGLNYPVIWLHTFVSRYRVYHVAQAPVSKLVVTVAYRRASSDELHIIFRRNTVLWEKTRNLPCVGTCPEEGEQKSKLKIVVGFKSVFRQSAAVLDREPEISRPTRRCTSPNLLHGSDSLGMF